MKTLEQYKNEFEAINEGGPQIQSLQEIENLELLAKECIANYPNEKIGFSELGRSIISFVETCNEYSKIDEISDLAKYDLRYIDTLESIVYGTSYVDTHDHIYRNKNNNAYSELFRGCGENLTIQGMYKEAASEYEIAAKLGVSYYDFIQKLNPIFCTIKIESNKCIKIYCKRGCATFHIKPRSFANAANFTTGRVSV